MFSITVSDCADLLGVDEQDRDDFAEAEQRWLRSVSFVEETLPIETPRMGDFRPLAV